jgi:hypothetical protein
MNGHITHRGGDAVRDDLADAHTISRLRIELHPAGRASREAIPVEIPPESTQPYPLGLGDDLCRLSSFRPRAPDRSSR